MQKIKEQVLVERLVGAVSLNLENIIDEEELEQELNFVRIDLNNLLLKNDEDDLNYYWSLHALRNHLVHEIDDINVLYKKIMDISIH